jgi:peptidoglycan/LPS O-acetylase OafA/YrhL
MTAQTRGGGVERATIPIPRMPRPPDRRVQPPRTPREAGPVTPASPSRAPAGVHLRLPALTGLRGVAALLVFVRHIYTDVESAVPAVAVLGDVGYAGVTFFFILSGYVLAWSTGSSTDSQFWWRRFARVYPLYFVAVWIWLGLAWRYGLFGEFGSNGISILPSLLLLQAWVPDQSIYFGWGGAVLWSLSCEAFFYLAFPFVYRRLAGRDNAARMRVALAVVVPTGLVGVLASFAGSRYDLAAYANPGLRIGEFVLGVALGLMAREGLRGTPGRRRLLAVGTTGWIAAALALGSDHGHRQGLIDTMLIPPFATIIFLVGTREADGRPVRLVGSRPAVYFGEISYAFYLIHPVALTIGVRLGWFDVLTAPEAALAMLAGLALSTALAAVLHHLVERPARRLLMRRRMPNPRHRSRRRMVPHVPWRAPGQPGWQPASGTAR